MGHRLPFIALLILLAGCQPDIGDSCSVDTECSATGERVCDTTQPGGYCTIFGCDPTNCPADESICIAFGNVVSTAPGCQNPNRTSPYVRNVCMATCNNAGDCRSGYDCVNMAEDNPWGAAVIQRNPRTTRICIAPMSAAPIPQERPSNVCHQPSPGAWPGFGGAGQGGQGGGGAAAGQGGEASE
jgi:hypothetical protein